MPNTTPVNTNGPAQPVYLVDGGAGGLIQGGGLTVSDGGTTYTVKTATATSTADGEYDVVSAVSSKKIRVLSLLVVVSTTAGIFQFLDGTGGTVKFQASCAIGVGVSYTVQPPLFLFETTSGVKLVGKNAVNVDSSVSVTYIEV